MVEAVSNDRLPARQVIDRALGRRSDIRVPQGLFFRGTYNETLGCTHPALNLVVPAEFAAPRSHRRAEWGIHFHVLETLGNCALGDENEVQKKTFQPKKGFDRTMGFNWLPETFVRLCEETQYRNSISWSICHLISILPTVHYQASDRP